MRATGIRTRWVNSDRQLADVLTKPNASPNCIQRLQKTGKWKIVWDANYTSAKNIRKAKRDQHFKNNQNSGAPFAPQEKKSPSNKPSKKIQNRNHAAQDQRPDADSTRGSQ